MLAYPREVKSSIDVIFSSFFKKSSVPPGNPQKRMVQETDPGLCLHRQEKRERGQLESELKSLDDQDGFDDKSIKMRSNLDIRERLRMASSSKSSVS
ncbi:MAG: hypothetical protein ACFFCS_24145 [Candidatus Hodarchaeota archaeon]